MIFNIRKDNCRMILANLKQVVGKGQGSTSNVKKQSTKTHDKKTPETFNTCDLPKNFFAAATRENFQTYQRKPKH